MDLAAISVPPAGLLGTNSDTSRLKRLAAAAGGDSSPAQRAKASEAVGQQFEAVFIRLLMRQMRRTIPESELLGGKSNARDIYEDIADATLADSISKRGGLGIGKLLAEDLNRTPAGQESGEVTEKEADGWEYLAQLTPPAARPADEGR